jgi:hypothetical protein
MHTLGFCLWHCLHIIRLDDYLDCFWEDPGVGEHESSQNRSIKWPQWYNNEFDSPTVYSSKFWYQFDCHSTTILSIWAWHIPLSLLKNQTRYRYLMHTLGFWLWHRLCNTRLNGCLDCFWDNIRALLFYWISHKQQKSPIIMCPAQLDHPQRCWKDLRLADDLNLCESIAHGAFPPFSNPPPTQP